MVIRKAMLELSLVVPPAWASATFSTEASTIRQQGIGETVKVQVNSVARLSKRAQELRLRRMEIGEDAALLIPLEVGVLRVEGLRMAKDARIGVVPDEERISIEVASDHLADSSIISTSGATGTFRQSTGDGHDLILRLQAVEAESLLLDARGGAGVPGYDGLDGASGKASDCLWDNVLEGGDDQSGSGGGPDRTGDWIRLEVPDDFPLKRLQTRLQGGVDGTEGKTDKPGVAGNATGCWIYLMDTGRAGRNGEDGANGTNGSDSRLDVVRF